ncbi:MAG: ATP-binding protein [Deltaproteobacteria bacterium]|nr:ATP-binding protein [Deltaproteobacteria bacterium]
MTSRRTVFRLTLAMALLGASAATAGRKARPQGHHASIGDALASLPASDGWQTIEVGARTLWVGPLAEAPTWVAQGDRGQPAGRAVVVSNGIHGARPYQVALVRRTKGGGFSVTSKNLPAFETLGSAQAAAMGLMEHYSFSRGKSEWKRRRYDRGTGQWSGEAPAPPGRAKTVTSFSLRGKAHTDILEPIRDLIQRAGAEAGVDEGAVYHLKLAVSEAVTNVIEHGYGERRPEERTGLERLRFQVSVAPGMMTAKIMDHSPPFDPRKQPEPTHLHADLFDRPIGGVGIHVMRKVLSSMRYASRGPWNTLTLVKRFK